MAGAKDLSATSMDVAAIKEIILKGKSTMPAAPVNDDQAQMIADYVHSSLKGK